MNERRRQPRVSVSGEVHGTIKSTIELAVLDLSESGMRIRTTTGLAPGSACELSLGAGSQRLKVRATVRRCRASKDGSQITYASGLEFEKLDSSTNEALRHLMEGFRSPGNGAGELTTFLQQLSPRDVAAAG